MVDTVGGDRGGIVCVMILVESIEKIRRSRCARFPPELRRPNIRQRTKRKDDTMSKRKDDTMSQPLQQPSKMPENYMDQFFSYGHLPPEMGEVSKPFCELGKHVIKTLPDNPERATALRKILEAKDCAVRAFLFKWPGGGKS